MSILDSARQVPLIQVPDSFEWIEVIQILVCDDHEVASRTLNPKPHPAMVWRRKLHDGLSRESCGEVAPKSIDVQCPPFIIIGHPPPPSFTCDVLTIEPRGSTQSTNCRCNGGCTSGVTVADARANLSVVAAALAAEYPDATVHSELWVEAERRARPMLEFADYTALMMAMVMALALLVLLIACANVAMLLVARGSGRQREMALRAGFGATWRRLIRQLLSESVLLALLGGAGRALMALWAPPRHGQPLPAGIHIGTGPQLLSRYRRRGGGPTRWRR